MKHELQRKALQQLYPQRPWSLRAPALCHVFLLCISSAIWSLEWLFEPPIHSVTGSSQAATDEAENLPQLRWAEYPALLPRMSQSLFSPPLAEHRLAIAQAPDTNMASKPVPVSPSERHAVRPAQWQTIWHIEVWKPQATAEKLHAAWQIAFQYEQAQSWALAQQAYLDVLQMDEDYWPAWQGLLRIAQKNAMQPLEAYVQQQLAQRWPVSQVLAEE